MQASPVVEYASPLTQVKSQRLLSLDVFRGLVILAMLVVNNIGDNANTGYFWKHADWPAMTRGHAGRGWLGYVTRRYDHHAEAATVEYEAVELANQWTAQL